ncbi:SHOCT domain-containing protein [Poseidonibacter ostreae]|uniref:SHOCT domain-containing protein n=2 Tax=Poseidonibacter ostreae TaxID=2654171 RepID=A0A6L4WSY9_9BACT|nr:SHOCT domain-containing protein [Poseidonibacter ostreae]KAB7889027.1 SHOCT domain-containing protein [Poseidonibacter ostreae]KAB7891975.1 SHOCT domain-containing protein [Poseidonibacter ostreae]MAD43128.1 electron transporter RnfE [Arcobacter sp.]
MNMNMTLFHGVAMFIFWFILVYLILSIFNEKKDSSAIDILKKRFAKSEITKEQFDEMKKSLI